MTPARSRPAIPAHAVPLAVLVMLATLLVAGLAFSAGVRDVEAGQTPQPEPRHARR